MQNSESLSVEWRTIGSIRPYPGNPRRISQTAVEKVASSIKEFGWRQPIVVDKAGEIIVGHTRFLAAKHLKLAKVPVHVAKGLKPDQVKAYRLADNRAGEETEWDLPALAIELKGLELTGFDLHLTAFTDADFARAFADPVQPITDPRAEWQGMPGYENSDARSFRKIVVHFKSQKGVDAFAKLLKQTIAPKAPFIWYPAEKREVFADKRYAAKKVGK